MFIAQGVSVYLFPPQSYPL